MHSVISIQHSSRINTPFWLPEQDSLGNVAGDRASKARCSLKRKEIRNTTQFSLIVKKLNFRLAVTPSRRDLYFHTHTGSEELRCLAASSLFHETPGYLPCIPKCLSHHHAGSIVIGYESHSPPTVIRDWRTPIQVSQMLTGEDS